MKLLLAGLAILMPVLASAQNTLKIGDPAPALTVGRFYKGEPITPFEPSKVYVLDFWGVWCGPCVRGIPHVSLLQRKYPNAVFIGVSEFDTDDELAKFVKDQGDRIGYRIAMDKLPDGGQPNHGGITSQKWMNASGDNSFPSMIIVAQNRIAWLGKPTFCEAKFDQIMSGKWDFEAAAKEYAANPISAQDQAAGDIQKLVDEAVAAKDSKAFNAALEKAWNGNGKYYSITAYAVDQALKPGSGIKMDLAMSEKLLNFLNDLSWPTAPFILDALAHAYIVDGKKEAAAQLLQRAQEASFGEDKKEIKAMLTKYSLL